MHRVVGLLCSVMLLVLTGRQAHAAYWKLVGPPVFETEVNGQPLLLPGQTKSIDTGEGKVSTTLISRTTTSAEFSTTHARYGTHRMTYTWDVPPEILHPGDVVPVGVRWKIAQKWTNFCPEMGSLSHLDWSEDWYTTQWYGYVQHPVSPTPGEERNTVIKVTTNNPTVLVFYWHVHCTPGSVRVRWTYQRVEENAPQATPSTSTAGSTKGNPTVQPPLPSALPTAQLGRVWEEVEGAWKGTWTRRGNSDTFDAVWTRDNLRATAVLTIEIAGNSVTVKRRQSSDGDNFDYIGTFSSGGTAVSGSYSVKGNQHNWSATILSDENAPTARLGRIWEEVEGAWKGTWTRRGNSDTFDAVWTRDNLRATAVLTVEIAGNNVTVKRRQSSDGDNFDYSGTLSSGGTEVSGSYSVKGNQYNWSARILP